jgi:hypothetical protein
VPTTTAWLDDDGAWRTTLRGRAVLADSRIDKGTAFTVQEREALGLVGALPPRVLTLEEQGRRAYEQFRSQPTALAKQVALNELRDRMLSSSTICCPTTCASCFRSSTRPPSATRSSTTATNAAARAGCTSRPTSHRRSSARWRPPGPDPKTSI